MKLDCLDNPNQDHRDVIIVAVPLVDTTYPLMAPAALKPVVEKTGKSCLAVDCNGQVLAAIKQHQHKDKIIKFFRESVVEDECAAWLSALFISMAEQIMTWSPSHVAISTFSYYSKNAMMWLAYFVKKIDPTVIVLVGGPGCLESSFKGPATLTENLVRMGIVDFHVQGDGEHAIYELLMGNTDYAGINTADWQQITNEELQKLPRPNYHDYDFSVYEKRQIGIYGSRGCVRKCKYCDYIDNWKKFTWRSAEDIFNEMIYQSHQYGIQYFKFQDALINGNLKEFNRLTELLANHNRHHPGQELRWSSYVIFRDWTASSEHEWNMIAASGAEYLQVGIENFNEHIRYDMGKKFSNHSLDLHLEQALKHNIKLLLMFITGWHTETQEDIDFAKRWLDTHQKYQPVISITFGEGSLGIYTNTYLDRNKDKLGIKMIGLNPKQWVKGASTPEVRSQWSYELEKHVVQQGYHLLPKLDNHYLLEIATGA